MLKEDYMMGASSMKVRCLALSVVWLIDARLVRSASKPLLRAGLLISC